MPVGLVLVVALGRTAAELAAGALAGAGREAEADPEPEPEPEPEALADFASSISSSFIGIS